MSGRKYRIRPAGSAQGFIRTMLAGSLALALFLLARVLLYDAGSQVLILTIALLLNSGVLALMIRGPETIRLTDTAIVVRSFWRTLLTVPYTGIESVEALEPREEESRLWVPGTSVRRNRQGEFISYALDPRECLQVVMSSGPNYMLSCKAKEKLLQELKRKLEAGRTHTEDE